MADFSKTAIDRLGDRLRRSVVSEADLRMLDEYRRSFGEAYEAVVQGIRQDLGLEPTGRPAKSTQSIVEKLNRESIRLVQMQDIAGCRVVVANTAEQERVAAALQARFPTATTLDRRAKPSYGYRAIHIVVNLSGKSVEIQIRTVMQHVWAELSEKLSDVFDPTIKYGGGSRALKELLERSSRQIVDLEHLEVQIDALQTSLAKLPQQRRTELQAELLDLQGQVVETHSLITDGLGELIRELDRTQK